MADELDLDFEIPVREAGTGQIKRVVLGASRAAVKSRTPQEMADEVVRKVAFPGTPDIKKRFRETALARINDVRDAIETREEMMKPVDKGGLGLPSADADRIIRIIDEVMKGGGKGEEKGRKEIGKVEVVPVAPRPIAPPSTVALPAKPTAPAPKPAAPPSPPAPPKPAPLPAPATAPPLQRDEVYEKLAEEVIRETGVALPPDIRRRLVIALVARLKDVRDSAETKDYLTRPLAAGGVGLPAAIAEQVLASANLRFSKISGEMERIEKEKTLAALKREREGEVRRVELREAGEEMARDELFVSITAKSRKISKPTTDYRQPTTVPAPKTPAAPFQIPIPPPPPARPKVVDVVPTMKLVGPVEELRVMTIADFRKLARDSKEACLKIRDKINLLGEESFEKRNAGINAWRESEPMRIYAELAATALEEGQAVPAQIAERTVAGKTTLTQEEFNAIMELNRILRF